MGKAKKRAKRQRKIDKAQNHRIALMEGLINEGDAPKDRHIMPIQQTGHIPRPWCWCHPTIQYEHPINFKRVYAHNFIIH